MASQFPFSTFGNVLQKFNYKYGTKQMHICLVPCILKL